MLRKDIADRLYGLIYRRLRDEQPERELTKSEMDMIWYSIYGKLCRGESETEVKEWCKTISLAGENQFMHLSETVIKCQ